MIFGRLTHVHCSTQTRPGLSFGSACGALCVTGAGIELHITHIHAPTTLLSGGESPSHAPGLLTCTSAWYCVQSARHRPLSGFST